VSGLSHERWSQLWLAATHQAAPAGLYDRLLALYAEPHRHYHNQRHIADCLVEFDGAAHLVTDPTAVEVAIWFHDAIYDTRAPNNEERSAELAVDWLKPVGAGEGLLNSVRQLVLATKAHDGTLHPDAPLLVDVDLSILGQPPERFWEYEQQIRAEYAWVEPAFFTAKRAEILERFLARPRLYASDYFYERYENQARVNLQASVQQLRPAP
jgi:predicted metal-dependent HD superfamily phosphohydrolase